MSVDAVVRQVLQRQIAHWRLAATRLGQLDDVASPVSWLAMERQVGVSLRAALTASVHRLQEHAAAAATVVSEARIPEAQAAVQRLRERYLRTETMLDFFADAINTRTNPQIAALLGAADRLAVASMTSVLARLGRQSPPVLSYIDKGLGASILKAGLRLWDGSTENPAAVIKVVRHNILRPTSLIHEAGHQVAHILDWNDELASALSRAVPGEIGEVFSGWASEIAADAFSFAHTGYASVAALHDVVDGGPHSVFLFVPGDPHPVGFVRVLLGVEMCRCTFGRGPWDDLAEAWTQRYPLSGAPSEIRWLLQGAVGALATVASAVLDRPRAAFGGVSLGALVSPLRVAPRALDRLAAEAGPALFASPHWLSREALRVLALTGYLFAVRAGESTRSMQRQLEWMLRLGAMQVPT